MFRSLIWPSSGWWELECRLIKMLKNKRPTWCHLLVYFTSYVLNMFRTLIYPSSGACDCVVELPHRSSCSQFVVCGSFCCGWCLVVLVLQAEAQLKMDILMSETCWAHNKWNKIASDISSWSFIRQLLQWCTVQ